MFRNYGMLDVFHHGTDVAKMIDVMDRHGVQVALMAGDNEPVAQAAEPHPGPDLRPVPCRPDATS